MNNDTESLEIPSIDSLRRQASRLRARARLVVVAPVDSREVIDLDDQPTELGRDRLGHASVSRRHLTITWHNGQHFVADDASKNGSWLDGAPLSDARGLSAGTVIRAGGVIMVYEPALPPAEISAASEVALIAAIPGRSNAATKLRETIARAAADPAPALVLGETGVGKERVAQALHQLSRRVGPFVAVNVAELSERLVESQLFGHVKGAFTGADAAQPGLFRAAHKGTLLLDEIGDLPLELQAKLLRVIQEREVRPVGATAAVPIDVRVVGATHADLTHAVDAGRFRRDLWARLALWELRVPPLAARRADILDYVVSLFTRWALERGRPATGLVIDPDAAEHLLLRPLPENLRALDRLVHRLDPRLPRLTLALVHETLGGPAVAEQIHTGQAAPAAPPTTAAELEAALAQHGSVHALARFYGKDRRQIYRWLEQFGLKSKR